MAAFEIPDGIAGCSGNSFANSHGIPSSHTSSKILRLLPVEEEEAFLLSFSLFDRACSSEHPVFRYGGGFVIEFLLAGYLGIVERVLWGVYDVRDVNENGWFYVEIFVKNCLIYGAVR